MHLKELGAEQSSAFVDLPRGMTAAFRAHGL
jgi:hypothetical protein